MKQKYQRRDKVSITNKTDNSDSQIDKQKLLLSPTSSFSVQEAYKTLRTNVIFSLPGNGSKCIGVISANRSEGKSSIAINLAISFAQIDKKVVVIDCDMRLPTVASKLSIDSVPGLSDFLIGEESEIKIKTMPDSNIDVITAGKIPPDSTVLIASQSMSDLIDDLKTRYDYLIFDFPPLTIVSDAVILRSKIDGYLVVVRHELSEYGKINETIRQLKFSNAKIIGFVYNGKSSEKKYYKGKKYYRGYYKNYYYKNYHKTQPKKT